MRGYGPKWKAAREAFLQANPWCRMCAQIGRQSRAVHVDHIEPHRRNWKLFWRRSNWQGLCATCHNGAKQQYEKSGTLRGCDTNGVPLDPGHHWAKSVSFEGGRPGTALPQFLS
jgi:hypothetical protein